MTKSRETELYNCWSFRRTTPDGVMFVFITEDNEGYPFRVDIHAGKTGNSLAAWTFGLSTLINELLSVRDGNGKRVYTIDKIAQLLSNITSGRYNTHPTTKEKLYHGPNGVTSAIMEYITTTYVEARKRA